MPPPRKILAAMRVVIGSKGAGAGLGRGELWPGTSSMLSKVAWTTWERSRVFIIYYVFRVKKSFEYLYRTQVQLLPCLVSNSLTD